jgi:hypothetical protein
MEAQVREVLSRVLVDDDFLNEMLRDPEQALRDYDLSDEERSVLGSHERDLLELMRISGGSTQIPLLDVDVDLSLDPFLFIDIIIDLTVPELSQRQTLYREKIASLAASALAMRARADRLEQIQQMLQIVSGAKELVSRSSGLTA